MIRSAIALAVVTSISASAQPSTADRLAWLAGCWEQRVPGRVVFEMWMPPAAGAMMGASRTITRTGVSEYEQLRVVARGDTLVYIASPSGQTTTEFRSTSITATSIAFENPTHDFPKLVGYTKTSPDSVVARIEGSGRTIQYPMRRISCTDTPAPPAAAPPPAPTDTLMFDAEFSPDGKRVAFVKAWGQDFEIHIGNPDGSATRSITNNTAVDYQPAWSPDGTRLAFVSVRDGNRAQIFTMRADGTDIRQLTTGTVTSSEPTWSPDGKQILFRSERDANRPHLFIMNADGSGVRQLTRDSAVATGPSFSRDGKQILFSSTQTGHAEVYIMNADGTGRRALTTTDQTGGVKHTGLPSYSPDGKLIAFYSNREGNQETYVMNADGSNVRNITNHPGADTPAGWTRDGYVIVRSARDRATFFDFYKVKPDGTGLTRMTTTAMSAR